MLTDPEHADNQPTLPLPNAEQQERQRLLKTVLDTAKAMPDGRYQILLSARQLELLRRSL